ncbi:MAG: hypothetical protein R2778_16890 [Saprospiraceae bacterium]
MLPKSGLEQRLLYGMYPEVLNRPGEEKEVLAGLASDNLYRDLLSFAPIRKTRKYWCNCFKP